MERDGNVIKKLRQCHQLVTQRLYKNRVHKGLGMAKPDPKQLHLFADDPDYFVEERLKYGKLGEYTKHELLNVPRADGPRLMPGRKWIGDTSHIDQEKLKTEETKYIDLRVEFEQYVRKQQDAEPHRDHGKYWPNSSKDGYLRIDESQGFIAPAMYAHWLRDSIDFYEARLAAIRTPETHGDNYRELAWNVAERRLASGLGRDGKSPTVEASGFEDRTIGTKSLEVGLYGKRLKNENRGFDPRGFRLDAHHIPYTVTVDIVTQTDKKIDEKLARGESHADARKDARKEARREARAVGPAIMIPWDVHKALHDARNVHVFAEAKGNRPVEVKETFEAQLHNDFSWLRDHMKWIGYSERFDINPAEKMLEQPIKKYNQQYPDPVATLQPAPIIIHNLGDINKLRGFDGKEVS